MDPFSKGKALTVLGPVSPDQLGFVLPHEQLLLDLRKLRKTPSYLKQNLEDLPMTIGNLGKIRQYPYSVSSNLILESVDDLIEELLHFKQWGGGTVCEVSVKGVRIKSGSLKYVSQATGINIVCGTGFYVESVSTDEYRNMTTDAMTQAMIDEITVGIPGTGGVRCGIIGEIGCSWPLTINERRVLQAAAQTQQQTGAPIMIHPGSNSRAPFEIIDVLRSAGADLSKTVVGHLDRTLFDYGDFVRLVETGCTAELDLFGTEVSHYQFRHDVDMPSDARRISIVKMLCDRGYSDRVFISQDIHTKHRLAKYGGHGFTHIVENIVPKMKERGISDDNIEKITVLNPKKWLTLNY